MGGVVSVFIDPYNTVSNDFYSGNKALAVGPSGKLWYPNGDGLDEFLTHP